MEKKTSETNILFQQKSSFMFLDIDYRNFLILKVCSFSQSGQFYCQNSFAHPEIPNRIEKDYAKTTTYSLTF